MNCWRRAVRRKTVDQLVRKILASPFALAVKLALLDSNPVASLPPLKSTRIQKGIFTAEEISKLIEKASPDWRGAILVGHFTGARLKDVCNLRCGNVDLEKRMITFRAGKTGQLITGAIHPELAKLEEYLHSRNISDDPQAFLFRSLAGKSGGGKSGLSMAFKRIMEQAEADAGVARLSSGAKGRSFSPRSFHSLHLSACQFRGFQRIAAQVERARERRNACSLYSP
jgi:integrase